MDECGYLEEIGRLLVFFLFVMVMPLQINMTEGFTEKDIIFGKLFKCVNQVGQTVMCQVAKEAYSHPSTHSNNGQMLLKDYCEDKSIHVDRNFFPQLMKCNIMDIDLDISAANIILKRICTDFYDSLSEKCKSNIKELVDMRNKICHHYGCTEEMMCANLNILKSLIKNIYKNIGRKTTKNFDNNLKDAVDLIDQIANSDLQTESSSDIESFKENLRFKFICDGRDQLRNAYSMLTVLNPCTWLGEIDYTILNEEFDASKRSRIDKFKVNKIFTPLKTKDKRSNIEVNELLSVTAKVRGQETLPQVLLLEGQAGCGKTSLCRFLIQEWCKTIRGSSHDSPVKNLPNYDLVILVELRRTRSNTFEEFLREELLSKVCNSFEREAFKVLLQELDLLIIIDGFDEKKDSMLVADIFENYNKRIVMSTRTRCLSEAELLARKESLSFLLVSVCGFDNAGLEHFAEKVFLAIEDDPCKYEQDLHNFKEMIKEKKHVVKTKKHMEEYELPLTIAFIIILWRDNPEKINKLTTSTRLYMEIINLFQEKLKERIKLRTRLKVNNKVVAELTLVLGEIAWKMLNSKEYVLSEELCLCIKQVCEKKKVNYLELLSAFLMCETNLDSDIDTLDFMFLHKTQMEYLAAAYLSRLIQTKQKTIEEISSEAKDCPEVLVYLTGYMAIQKYLNGDIVYEIVTNIKESQTDFSFWWDLYAESLEHQALGKLIVNMKLPKFEWELGDDNVVCGLKFMSTNFTKNLKKLKIKVERDPNDMPSLLEDMEAVRNNSNNLIKTDLSFQKQNDPNTKGTSDKYLVALANWGSLIYFVGSLGREGCEILPNFHSLVTVRCRLSNPEDVQHLSKCLPKLKKPLRQLRVTLDLTPGCTLPPSVDLHPCDNLELWLYGITDKYKEWLVDEVIMKVTGADGCRRIHLQNCNLNFQSLEWIVEYLCGPCMEKLVVKNCCDLQSNQKSKLSKLATYRIDFEQ